ncbi:putative quinol monooxygenase [Moritella viscosa]|uniref:Lipoprotein n=1 Tax=Moritella viscosa TaxID=80854 RepID=A0A1K9YXT4_9GAMM|nr:putative quinol monooxygenase [Moritella viscosa]SGY85384.1 Lipoprotein [Moritella viscosa]SGY86015.1 Lipoprotein [Moritella viscosa]SGY86389.1 Lipoprotein [Moritella viscosa]SGY87674.1 Lipoprotein [Moritella viscosa]SGZ18447.1 Lipoprotein [Moritella viscosa]
MPTPLTIIANIEAKADQMELVKTELLKLIEPTRLEEGCIQYDLHQDNNNPALFTFVENWASHELLQKHLNSPHLKMYMQTTEGAVATFTLNEITKIA